MSSLLLSQIIKKGTELYSSVAIEEQEQDSSPDVDRSKPVFVSLYCPASNQEEMLIVWALPLALPSSFPSYSWFSFERLLCAELSYLGVPTSTRKESGWCCSKDV